jgi:hypothetical protein
MYELASAIFARAITLNEAHRNVIARCGALSISNAGHDDSTKDEPMQP